MNKNSVFDTVNSHILTFRKRNDHLRNPVVPFKMIVDEQARLLVFATKREYLEYLDSRDVELCKS